MTNQSVPLREQIAIQLCDKHGSDNWDDIPSGERLDFYEEADQIIKDCHIVQLADDQTLPKVDLDIHIWRDYKPDMAYEKAQQDMLTPANGMVWKKVKAEG